MTKIYENKTTYIKHIDGYIDQQHKKDPKAADIVLFYWKKMKIY